MGTKDNKLPVVFEATETVETCKRCFREKVNGKCPACGAPFKFTPKQMEEKALIYMEQYKTIAEDPKSTKFPSIAGLASFMELSRETLHKHINKNESYYNKELADICKKILTDQEMLLLERGLEGTYNSAIVKLVLGKHGYSDKQEIDMGEKTYEFYSKQQEKYKK